MAFDISCTFVGARVAIYLSARISVTYETCFCLPVRFSKKCAEDKKHTSGKLSLKLNYMSCVNTRGNLYLSTSSR